LVSFIRWLVSFSTFFGFTNSFAPMRRAIASFAGLVSTPMIMRAPASLAPCTTLRPMPPSPNTTTELLLSTFAANSAAPRPVVAPQPM
jgi:hypothetical protein